MDQNAIEDLFERNADMRLLELRHGNAAVLPSPAHSTSSFGAESIIAGAEAGTEDAARLRVAIAAAPASGVIPGALVGIAIDVFNDGGAPAPPSKLLLSIPHESEYRNGTLRIDGREPVAPEELFGTGLPIARLPGESAAKVTLQLCVRPGLSALYLQPRLQTDGVPVVGTIGISIERGPLAPTAPPNVRAVPFYELDDDELAEEECAEAAPPILPPVLALEPVDRPVEEPAAAKPPQAEPPQAEPPPLTADRMPRFRSIASADVAFAQRLFAPSAPGLIAHFVVISTIACTEPESEPDTSGLEAFVRADLGSLGRALVLSRLRKPPAYAIDQRDLARIDLTWNASPATASRAGARFRRDLRQAECATISGLLQPSERDAGLRFRIALLTLAGATLDGAQNAAAAEACATALAAYRSAALAWLVPLCLASARAGAPNGSVPPAAADDAARDLLRALSAALNE